MIVIITLIIFIVIIFILMSKSKNSKNEVVNKNLSKQIESSEVYISKAVQRNFFDLGATRLTKEQFQSIIENERDGQKEMFLTYLFDHYYGCDTPNMKYVPFSTLITEASKKSGLRIES